MGDQRRPQVGDVVTVRGKVITRASGPDPYEVEFKDGKKCWFEKEEITSIEPRPFAVGDRVAMTKWMGTSEPARPILGIHEGYAWFGGFVCASVGELRRVDEAGS